METSSAPVPPLNVWNKNYICAGAVGSVGDCLVGVQYRRSSAELPVDIRINEGNGSNIIDGNNLNQYYTGSPARVSDSTTNPPEKRYQTGTFFSSVKPVDRLVIPKYGEQPQAGWKNLVAQPLRAKNSGVDGVPFPGTYGPTALTRGGQTPQRYLTGENVSASNIGNLTRNPNLAKATDYSNAYGLSYALPNYLPTAGGQYAFQNNPYPLSAYNLNNFTGAKQF